MPPQKEGVSSPKTLPLFSDFAEELPIEQKINQMKSKSGLLIYDDIYVCVSFVKTPTHVIKATKCLAFQGLVRIIRYLYPIKLV